MTKESNPYSTAASVAHIVALRSVDAALKVQGSNDTLIVIGLLLAAKIICNSADYDYDDFSRKVDGYLKLLKTQQVTHS